MAITKLEYPTAGTPSVDTDYNLQNQLTAALAKQGVEEIPFNNNRTLTATPPDLLMGVYIRHNNCIYVVDTSDYTILGTPAVGLNYVSLQGIGDTITANWVTSTAGYTYDAVRNGWYDVSNNQLMQYVVSLTVAGYVSLPMESNNVSTVIAANDSAYEDKVKADLICTGTSDDIVINSAIEAQIQLNNSVYLMAGTYNIDDEIYLSTSLAGDGRAIVKATTAMTYGVNLNTSITYNVVVSGIEFDGNSLCDNGFYANGYDTMICRECISKNNAKDGFKSCNNISNCTAYNNPNYGFHDNENLINCLAHNNSVNGFYACRKISNCYSYDNNHHGFSNSIDISSCKAQSNGTGFNLCNRLSSCYSYANTDDGFKGCKGISSCRAELHNTGASNGFYTCHGITSCYSYLNDFGFHTCSGMTANESKSNGTNYFQSFASWAATNTCADTATGGYNG